jgi:predicted acylesterase/phospholipase RssA
MGRIAQVGTDAALQLFRDILLASAAVPGVFPPVPVTVMAGGRTFQEFHVDGGPTREVFISPVGFSFRSVDALVGAPIKRRLWVIRNGKLSPEYANVDLTAASIAVRALETLTKNQGLGDLLRIYDRARTDGIDFNLASIPPAFSEPRPSPFAQSYMTALYKTGYTLGRAGYRWAKSPPGAATAGPR